MKETEQNGVEARSEGETAAGSAPHDDKEFGSQDQASAKSTNHQVNMPADDAPGDLPNTDADTNDEHGNQTEHRPGSRQMADEGEEEVERIGDGDEDTVIY